MLQPEAGHDPLMSLHPAVQDFVAAYLAGFDAEAPGLVEGLYLTGSAVLDDFHLGASDVDFVAVSRAAPTDREVAALRRAHDLLAARHPRPSVDGLYVTWQDLAGNPLEATPGPHINGGVFSPSNKAGRSPVTWHSLAHHGFAVRGPRPQELKVWTDQGALAEWTRDNLDSYWRRWWRRSTCLLSKAGLASLGGWAPAWGVLGVSRLHYTLATGRITSKSGAGTYARATFNARWHRIIDECLRIRRGAFGPSLYGNPLSRRRDALAFMDVAIEDAHRVGGRE